MWQFFLNRFLLLFIIDLSFSHVDSDWCLCIAMIYIFSIILLRIILLSEVCAVFRRAFHYETLFNLSRRIQYWMNSTLRELVSLIKSGNHSDVSFPNHNEFVSLEWAIPEMLWNVSYMLHFECLECNQCNISPSLSLILFTFDALKTITISKFSTLDFSS